ncbi:hypothetical protein DFH28DRAFT_882303, partial [Melampsora americana]
MVHQQWHMTLVVRPGTYEDLKIAVRSQMDRVLGLEEHPLRKIYEDLAKVETGRYSLIPIQNAIVKHHNRGRPHLQTNKKKRRNPSKEGRWKSAHELEETEEAQRIERAAKRARGHNCGHCSQSGHNRKTCPTRLAEDANNLTIGDLQTDVEEEEEGLIEGRKENLVHLPVHLHLEEDNPEPPLTQTSHRSDLLELALLEDSGTISVKRLGSDSDEDNVCLWCEEPLPSAPSKRLEKLKATLCALPNAMSLPFPQTASFCNLHRAERDVIPLGKLEGWPLQIDFDLLKKRIQTHTKHLYKIIEQQEPSVFLDIAQRKWKTQGRFMFTMSGEFDGFEVEQPGYYGPIGFEIMIKTLTDTFMSEASDMTLDVKKASPFPKDYFTRRILVPELALQLIAEDLNLPTSDPKVMNTLESSRLFGVAVFSNDEE